MMKFNVIPLLMTMTMMKLNQFAYHHRTERFVNGIYKIYHWAALLPHSIFLTALFSVVSLRVLLPVMVCIGKVIDASPIIVVQYGRRF